MTRRALNGRLSRRDWLRGLILQEQMEHVHWEGCHFEDLIYPLFLFIVGLGLH